VKQFKHVDVVREPVKVTFKKKNGGNLTVDAIRIRRKDNG